MKNFYYYLNRPFSMKLFYEKNVSQKRPDTVVLFKIVNKN
jgi:hypothetical protein